MTSVLCGSGKKAGKLWKIFARRVICQILIYHNIMFDTHYLPTGKVKSIGVSNYTIRHLKEMEQYATILPHLLQVTTYMYM